MKRLLLALAGTTFLTAPAMAGGGRVVYSVVQTTYTGPGNTLPGAEHFWGMVALDQNRATAGAQIVTFERNGGTTCTVTSLPNGKPNLTGPICSGGTETVPIFCGTDCRLRTWFDQGYATPLAPLDQPVRANQIPITFNCSGDLPCVEAPDNSQVFASSTSASTTQPMTFIAAVNRTGAAAVRPIVRCGIGNYYILGTGNVNLLRFNFGKAINPPMTDNAFHSYQISLNGVPTATNSAYKVDGAANVTGQDAGTGICAANIRLGYDGTTNAPGFKMLFMGQWNGKTFSDYDQDAMFTTVHTVGQF